MSNIDLRGLLFQLIGGILFAGYRFFILSIFSFQLSVKMRRSRLLFMIIFIEWIIDIRANLFID